MKAFSVFVCQNCGFESPKWAGQCPSCGQWNSLVETAVVSGGKRGLRRERGARREAKEGSRPLRLEEVESLEFSRIETGIAELDRVLGGGLVPGSVVLVAGEPGMGKSTLLTQLALKVANFQFSIFNFQEKKKSLNSQYSPLNTVFYVCGEESPGQVKLRIERLVNNESNRLRQDSEDLKVGQIKNEKLKIKNENSKIKNYNNLNLFLLPETNVENILQVISNFATSNVAVNSNLVIVDSIQTLWTETLSGMSGSVGQIRECANILAGYAKQHNVPVFLVGHVTKEGAIAGPKILEHMVDTVLYLEGDKNHEFRILRAVKNRFGPTDEVGVFTMSDRGMEEVENPAEVFLQGETLRAARSHLERAGSCTVVTMQGLRPILVEIQALCVKTFLPVPRRIGRGIDHNRLQILCAVLQKKAGIPLYNQDIFLSVAGGLKIDEPAVDFGICLAVVSSYKNKNLPEKAVAIGEIGMLGEIRKVSFLEKRIKQAKALGYQQIIGPQEYGTVGEAIKEVLRI